MLNILANLIRDIRCHKGSLFIMLVQIVATALILCYGISVCSEGFSVGRQVKNFDDSYSICKLCETMETNQFDATEKDDEMRDSMMNLLKYIKSADDIDHVTVDNGIDMVLDSSRCGFDEKQVRSFAKYTTPADATFKSVMVNDEFFRFFHLKVREKPYVDDEGTIHVLLGDNFKGVIKKGDVFYDTTGTKFIAEGFIKKGCFFTNPYQDSRPKYLDSYIVGPVSTIEDTEEPLLQLLTTFIILNNNETGLENLEKAMKDNDIDWFEIEDYSNHIKYTIMEIWSSIILVVIASVLLCVFAAIGTIAMMLNYIDEHLYEFSVHRVCGARKSDIIVRLSMPLIVSVLVSAFVTIALMGLKTASVVALCAVALFGIIIIIYPVRVVGKIDIVNELRNRR